MKIVRAIRRIPLDEEDALLGKYATRESYDVLIDESADVICEDGSPLLKLRRGVLGKDEVDAAWREVVDFRRYFSLSLNRGIAAGGERFYPYRLNNSASKTSETKNAVQSALLGFLDRYPRMPYCRQTAFNVNHPDVFSRIEPFIRSVNEVFRSEAPERHEAQMERVRATVPDYIISGTAFSTVTINNNWQTAFHRDAGDLRAGFGVLSVHRRGSFEGCYLCFPAYRVAVNLRERDVLLANVHEIHGNTPVRATPGKWRRVSWVFYYREKMDRCLPPAEELLRANVNAERILKSRFAGEGE